MALRLLRLSAEPRRFRTDLVTAELHTEGSRTVIGLRGEADASTRLVLCDVLSRVIARSVGDAVVDLRETMFIDAAAVRVLAAAEHLLDDGDRRLTFRSPSLGAARVLVFFGLADLIEADTGVAG